MTTYHYRDGREFTGTPTVIDEHRATAVETHKCHRCGGAGGWKGWPGFTCYRCNGTRYEAPKTVKLYSRVKLDKLNATREARRAKIQAKKEAAAEARKADKRTGFADWLKTDDGKAAQHVIKQLAELKDQIDECGQEIVSSITERFDDSLPLTERQIEVLFKIHTRIKRAIDERENSEHLGQIGEAITVEGELRLIWEDPWGAYGWKGIYTIKTPAGHVVKYCGSTFLRKGHIKLTGTIKAHEEYKGVNQTVISRPRNIQ